MAVTGKKEFILSDGELPQIKQDTADTLARLRAVTQKINSVFDFLPMGDSRAYGIRSSLLNPYLFASRTVQWNIRLVLENQTA